MPVTIPSPGLWEKHIMALDKVTERMEKVSRALGEAGVPFALVGGQAVAIWVASKEPAAVRTTKDVDILLRREDLPQARAAALKIDFDYLEILGVGMFLDRTDPNPRNAVHIVWAGEKVRPENLHPAPTIEKLETLEPGKPVVSLAALVSMKLLANRDQDRVHLRDMIDVGLVNRDLLKEIPADLSAGLDALLTEAGR
jgi:hypothetical protein